MAAGELYFDHNGDSGSYLVYFDSSNTRRRIDVYASGHALPSGVSVTGTIWIVANAGGIRLAKTTQGKAFMVDTNGASIVSTTGTPGHLYVSGSYLYSVDNRGYVVRQPLGTAF